MAELFRFVVCLLVVADGVMMAKNLARYGGIETENTPTTWEEFKWMLKDLENGERRFFDLGEPPNGFSWSNCGDPKTELLVLQSLSVSPDPMQAPGKVMVSFMGNVTKTLAAPLQVSVVLKKKMVFWITVPCIDGVGSCTYNDVCSMITACPTAFKEQGIPCNCPVKQALYKLTNGAFSINANIPGGEYRMTASISMQGVAVGCYNINFNFS